MNQNTFSYNFFLSMPISMKITIFFLNDYEIRKYNMKETSLPYPLHSTLFVECYISPILHQDDQRQLHDVEQLHQCNPLHLRLTIPRLPRDIARH